MAETRLTDIRHVMWLLERSTSSQSFTVHIMPDGSRRWIEIVGAGVEIEFGCDGRLLGFIASGDPVRFAPGCAPRPP